MFQPYFVCFLYPDLEPAIYKKEINVETKIWAVGVFIAIGLIIVSRYFYLF